MFTNNAQKQQKQRQPQWKRRRFKLINIILFIIQKFVNDTVFIFIANIVRLVPNFIIRKSSVLFFTRGYGDFTVVKTIRKNLIDGVTKKSLPPMKIRWDPFKEVEEWDINLIDNSTTDKKQKIARLEMESGTFRTQDVAKTCSKSRYLKNLMNGEVRRVSNTNSSKTKRVAILLPFTGDQDYFFRVKVAEELIANSPDCVCLIPELPFYGSRNSAFQSSHVSNTVSDYTLMQLIVAREMCGLIEWTKLEYGDGVSIVIGGFSMGAYIATLSGILASLNFHDENKSSNSKLGVVSMCGWHNFENLSRASFIRLRADKKQLRVADSSLQNYIFDILVSSESDNSSQSGSPDERRARKAKKLFSTVDATVAAVQRNGDSSNGNSKQSKSNESNERGENIFKNLSWLAIVCRTLQKLLGVEMFVNACGGEASFANRLDAMVFHFAKRDKLIAAGDQMDLIKKRCIDCTKPGGAIFTYDKRDHLANAYDVKGVWIPSFLQAFECMENSKPSTTSSRKKKK